jgi:kynurenine formamidase
MEFIDLTHLFDNEISFYPGDKKPKLKHIKEFGIDGHNDFRIETSMHVGTHMDGPMHLTGSDKYLSEIELSKFMGQAAVIDVRGESLIRWKDAYAEKIKGKKIVLICTGFDKFFNSPEYFTGHPVVGMDFASAMKDMKIEMLGMDIPSPDKAPFEIHKSLLSDNILIIENLDNLEILLDKKEIEIIALPMKIKADSACARVIARFS